MRRLNPHRLFTLAVSHCSHFSCTSVGRVLVGLHIWAAHLGSTSGPQTSSQWFTEGQEALSPGVWVTPVQTVLLYGKLPEPWHLNRELPPVCSGPPHPTAPQQPPNNPPDVSKKNWLPVCQGIKTINKMWSGTYLTNNKPHFQEHLWTCGMCCWGWKSESYKEAATKMR